MTWQTVHVRVNEATGKPTPVRISFFAQGRYFVPFGRSLDTSDMDGHLLQGAEPFVHIEGACEIRLPAGEVDVHILKGIEYVPIESRVTLRPGQLALRFNIERWTDPRSEGWYAGDVGAYGLSPHGALLEGAAEDLAVVWLLASDEGDSIPNMIAFSGQSPCLERDGHWVAVGTRNEHSVLGALGLLYAHRAVFPLRFGDEEGSDDWSLQDWCEQCHRKKGLVVWSDTGPTRLETEALANLLAGEIDAFEITHFDEVNLRNWMTLLNAGLRVPVVGSGGKSDNATALGAVRTYAKVEGEFSLHNWIEAVRAGRTLVTNGPWISFSVNGKTAGSVLKLAAGEHLSIRAEMRTMVPVDFLEIFINGELVALKETSGNREGSLIEMSQVPESSCWIVARAWADTHLADGQPPMAFTSPIYVEVENEPFKPDPDAVAELDRALNELLRWTREEAKCPGEKERRHLEDIFKTALDRLKQLRQE